MTYWEVLILAAVQGITEFLPISSSGQLVAARNLFGISDISGGGFDAWLHLGTLGAVLVYFRRTWLGIIKGMRVKDEEGRDKRNLLFKLIVATIPAAIIGYLAKDLVETHFRSSMMVAAGLLVTAAALLLADLPLNFKKKRTSDRAGWGDAFIIGIAQVAALLPGISRSGITIAAGLSRGLSRQQATAFSFLMSAPIIAGAGLLGLGDLFTAGDTGVLKLLVGLVVAFATAFASIAGLLKFVEKRSFFPFVVYIVALAVVLVIYG